MIKNHVYKLVIDAVFECNKHFTKEELVNKLKEKNIQVKDTDALMSILLKSEIIVQEESLYHISIENILLKYLTEVHQNKNKSTK